MRHGCDAVRLVALAALVAVNGCGASAPTAIGATPVDVEAPPAVASAAVAEAPALAMPVPGELALVRADARLRLAAAGDGPVVRLYDADAEQPAFYALRVVAVAEDWVEVESLPEEVVEGQCAAIHWKLGAYRLRFFVRLGDLVPVVREPIRHQDDAATWVVEPGEPLVETEAGLELVQAPFEIAALPFAVEVASAGRSYARETLLDNDHLPRTEVRLSDLGLPYRWAAPHVRIGVDAAPADGDEQTVTLRSLCTTLTVTVPAEAVAKIGWGRGSGIGTRRAKYRVAEGTEVRWASGAVAGATLREVSYHAEPVHVSDDLGCFDVSVGPGESDGTLRVCHAAEAIEAATATPVAP